MAEPQLKNDRQRVLSQYRHYAGGRRLAVAAFVLLLAVLAVVALCSGVTQLSPRQIFDILLGASLGSPSAIVWNIRLPRILVSMAAGAGLAVAGTAMQSILRNPLGSPFTLGIAHAAAFGASLSIVVLGAEVGSPGGSSAIGRVLAALPHGTNAVMVSAFAWSLVSTFAILIISKQRGATPESMILTGVALGSLFTAGTAALQYFADDIELAAVVFWAFGDVGRASWSDFGVMLAVVIPALAYFLLNRWNYNALDSGAETAQSLGVAVDRVRLWGMLAASLVTAVIVSFVGIIGFIGLVVPHIVRKLVGGDQRYLVPLSALGGAILLLAADTVARTALAPIVLPVGILTSFLGAPLFIYLVARGRDYW